MIKQNIEIVKLYEAVMDKLVEEFADHMGYEDYDGYRIGGKATVCQINDQFRNTDDMYITMKHDIAEDIVFNRYDDSLEKKTKDSLYHYRRKKTAGK